MTNTVDEMRAMILFDVIKEPCAYSKRTGTGSGNR